MDIQERLKVFLQRLAEAEPADGADGAMNLVCRLIEEVEQEIAFLGPDVRSTRGPHAPRQRNPYRGYPTPSNLLSTEWSDFYRAHSKPQDPADQGGQVVMKIPSRLQDLIGEIVHLHPCAHLEVDPLPSGVCFLWVALLDRNFVLEYHPTRGTGVSENLPNTPPFVGHDRVFGSLDEAADVFKVFLAEAAESTSTQPLSALHERAPKS